MQPKDPEKKPAVHATPPNHGPVDRRLPAGGVAQRQRRALALGGIRRGAAGHDICFVHPKGSEERQTGGEGVLIELVQAPRRWWRCSERCRATSRCASRKGAQTRSGSGGATVTKIAPQVRGQRRPTRVAAMGGCG